MFRIDGGMPEFDEILDDEWFEFDESRHASIEQIFVERFELGEDGREQPIPDGFGENGICVRETHDYAQPRVAGPIGAGQFSTMIACISEVTWVERRIALVDAVRQVGKVRAEKSWLLSEDASERWRDVEEERCFRYVNWIGARGISDPRCIGETTYRTALPERYRYGDRSVRDWTE